jgi:hypothetical protein
MSEKKIFNFTDLLNFSCENEAKQIKHLQMVLKILVTQLKLEEVEVDSSLIESLKNENVDDENEIKRSNDKTVTNSEIPSQSNAKFSKASSKFNVDGMESFVNQQLEIANQVVNKSLSQITENVCELQKKSNTIQDQIDDLFFACKQNDIRNDEISRGTNNFNSKIFCLKTDVKSLLNDSESFKEKFVEIYRNLETMNKVKTNKSYVDELWNQKAYKSDLEKFVNRDEFDPMTDVLKLKFSLMQEELSKLQENLKTRTACLKLDFDDKMEKNEVLVIKENILRLFEGFKKELQTFLLPFVRNPVSAGGARKLENNMNCIACDTRIEMVKSAETIPKLETMSRRLKLGIDKIDCKKTDSTSKDGFRQLLCSREKSEKIRPKSTKNPSLLNFPNSQHCFVIAEDNTIVRADPLKCLNNPNYINLPK